MLNRVGLFLFIVFGLLFQQVHAQAVTDPHADSTATLISPRYIDQTASKAQYLTGKLDKKTEQTLAQMKKQELRMKNKLARIDSTKAKEMFGDIEQKYQDLQHKLTGAASGAYVPSLDTLATSLKFLKQHPQAVSLAKGASEKVTDALSKVKGLEDQFKKAEQVKKFLKERKDYLKRLLGKLGFAKELKKISKQSYYYQEQLAEYKSLLTDHKKAEKKALELLSRTKLFKDFMRKNSMLASLFRMPGDPADPNAQAGLAGLQTRTQVNNLIQQQIGSGGSNAQQQFRQNMQDAQSQLNQLKNKMNIGGKGSSEEDMPEGFKPNNEKSKSFLKRLELGTNLQTQRATYFFPVTTDIGLSLGYKLNDRSIVGIGGSYKLGMGRGWNHIRVTSEGVGLRSFIDWKIKGSLWLSGGYEQNYKTAFSDFSQLKDQSGWQQSGLVGLSKVVSLRTKFFKKTKLQLLWDFLSYQQVPEAQPVVFRIGYNF